LQAARATGSGNEFAANGSDDEVVRVDADGVVHEEL
jgi:hypothetical protein